MGRVHYAWIDTAKGIGIILVIMGHCMFPCHALIDMFHMPLFFILAGITFSMKPFDHFIISKINRIMVPYVFWVLISSILNLLPHNYSGPYNGPLWFLSALFTSLIFTYLLKCIKNGGVKCVILIASWVITYLFIMYNDVTFPFSLRIALLSSVYIYIGIRLKCLKEILSHKKQICAFAVITILGYLGLFGYVYTTYHPTGSYVSLDIFSENYVLVFICSIIGTLATIGIAKLVDENRVLSWLGRNSLMLMCVHFPFAQTLNVWISNLDIYNTVSGKAMLAIWEYVVVFMISIGITMVCRKHIPALTGYKPFISNISYNHNV